MVERTHRKFSVDCERRGGHSSTRDGLQKGQGFHLSFPFIPRATDVCMSWREFRKKRFGPVIFPC